MYPIVDTLTHSVIPDVLSCTKMSPNSFTSPGTRRGVALEDDEPPIAGDRRLEPAAVVVPLGTVRRDADALGRALHEITHEYVGSLVPVSRDEVVRVAQERHEPAVRRDRGAVAVLVPPRAVCRDARDARRAQQAIAHED